MRCLACFMALSLALLGITKSPAADQIALAKELGKKSQQVEIWTDDDGNVTGLIFINHQALTPSAGVKPGITNTDLLQFTRFPKLEALNFEAQAIGDTGLQVLREFPQMKQVGFHYMAKAEGAQASPRFITVIDGMRDLEIIEIKHNFRMNAIAVEELRGPFPKVWRLVLDTPLTSEQTMHMVRLCPNVKDLQLHRTDVTPEQIAEIGRLLPRLEVLWLKPKGGVTAEQLRALAGFKRLRILSPQALKQPVEFEGGWDTLTGIPHLERLEISEQARELNSLAVARLLQVRPQLIVDSRLTRSRNYKGL